MEVRFALLADYAATMAARKLLIVGEFDAIYAATEPVTYGPFYMVGRLEAHVSEGTEHKLRIGLYDADGHQVGERSPDIPFTFLPGGPGRPLRAQFIAKLVMTFPKYGSYEFHVTVDGRTDAVIQVNVQPPPVDGKA